MQPAAATTNAHMSLSLMAATASQPPRQQQQEHSASGQSPQGQGAPGSRLATVETGPDDDAAGGSVDMTCPGWRQNQHQQAASEPLRAGGAAAAGGHPAASAPMVLPGQAVQPDQPQPAISVSLSAQGEEGAGPAPGAAALPCWCAILLAPAALFLGGEAARRDAALHSTALHSLLGCRWCLLELRLPVLSSPSVLHVPGVSAAVGCFLRLSAQQLPDGGTAWEALRKGRLAALNRWLQVTLRSTTL